MKLVLSSTEYGIYVQKLGDSEVYRAGGRFGFTYFTTLEEARQAAHESYQGMVSSYKRSCAGRTAAFKALAALESEGGSKWNLG